jgi:very-short-patch-repair endonuclease
MNNDSVIRAAMRCGGTATWARLRQDVPRRAIERAVRDGELVRLGRGTYALPKSPDALRAALVLRGVASHESAARLWFMDTLVDPTVAHVTVPKRANASASDGIRLHWVNLDEGDVRGRVTSPLRTVLDCARSTPFEQGLAIADSALRRGLVGRRELEHAAARSGGKGVATARRVASSADARAANPFESALRATTLDLGLSDFVPQLAVRTPGLRGYVDLGDAQRKIALEADSFEWHGTRAALERDCRRYDELVRSGWLVLRFSWEQVMFERTWVADVIADTVALRPRGHKRGTTWRRSARSA